MKSTSTAEAISAQLLALLPQHPAETTVHSVFHTSANLLYQGQLVTLLDDTRPLYPCAVRLGGSIPSVAAGEPALLSRERITFPHSGHTIELHRAAVTSLSLFSPLLPLQRPPPHQSHQCRISAAGCRRAALLGCAHSHPNPLFQCPIAAATVCCDECYRLWRNIRYRYPDRYIFRTKKLSKLGGNGIG